MIETKVIAHFTIRVSDYEKRKVYYREVLGLKKIGAGFAADRLKDGFSPFSTDLAGHS